MESDRSLRSMDWRSLLKEDIGGWEGQGDGKVVKECVLF